MRTRSRALPFAVAVTVLCATAGQIGVARAFDGTSSASDDRGPLPIFKNPKAALRAGLEGVRSGHKRSAIAALQYAADGGEPLARWKLGKMYASGDGVPQDDAKAFDYFSQIIDNYDEDESNPHEAPFVANAFVALGAYDLSGIANSRVLPDPSRALEMFHYAAVNFGDAAAQYNLARMFLDGTGVPRDRRQAARWLYLAADKGHIESEAVLGQLLFNGYDNMAPQRARGLMWLSLAREGVTDHGKDQWILDLYAKAMDAASDSDRQMSALYLDDHAKRR